MLSTAEATIRIDDLRNPVLTDAHREELNQVKRHPADLTENAVLAAARARTQLDDFGAEDFRDRLRTWLAEIDADPSRSELGRMMAFRRSVRWASIRLRLQDLMKRHPEIRDAEVERPIVVVGLPRSGTTHLLNLLATDNRLRSLPLWESYEPIPAPGEVAGEGGIDPRYARCEAKWKRMQQLLPHCSSMHSMDPDHITEEIELQGADFSAGWLQTTTLVPRWADRYKDEDQTPHYAYMKNVLQALQWQRGPNRWVLKSPGHAEHLDALMATFPDATVVMTHRDPLSVVQSALTMFAYFARLEFEEIDIESIAAYWIERIENIIRGCVQGRSSIPDGQLIDILFHQFMGDEFKTVERVYRAAGLELGKEDRARVVRFLNDNPRNKNGRVAYNLKSDFGIDPQRLRERFGFYYERFPVAVEK